MKNKQHNLEEKEILSLIDALERDELISSTESTSEGYKHVFSLLRDARTTINPNPEQLKALLAKLPVTTTSSLPFEHADAIKSPYRTSINWLYAGPSPIKYTAPFIVILFAVAVIIGTSPRKGMDPLSIAPPQNGEVITEATNVKVAEIAVPTSFAVADNMAPALASRELPMSKMSLTTVPSTTPQNIGELIALLSSEADGDVDLGLTDLNDPLLSVDQASVDAIQLSYDVQTI